MKFKKVEQYLSVPRIHRYLQICNADKNRAVNLYQASLRLSQAFHPLLGVLEVVLRNQIYDALAKYFNDPDWIITESGDNGFMSSPTLVGTDFFLRRQVRRTIGRLQKRGANITGPRVMSEQTFGFWTDLLEPHHFRLIGGSPMRAFANLAVGKKRVDVANELSAIRRFRNRINHNEPILLRGNTIDFTTVDGVYGSIIDMFIWLDPELISWIKALDKVPRALSMCKQV